MFKKKQQLTRLGDVLVDKGIISKAQLDIAIQEQSRRKKLLDPSDPTAQVTPIGEILIELGFIDRLQLKRGLNWQQRLRHVSIAMALCAPFMMFVPNIARAGAITVEAESYTTMSGVVKETTADVGGGQNLGDINTGDWMTYSNINVPATGTYKITYRVSSYNGGAIISLRDAANTSLGSVPIPKTGSWSNWVEVEQTVTLKQGTQSLKIFAEVGGLNLNWFKIEQVSAPVADPAVPAFPLTLQAENYTTMSGVVKETSSDVGGGQTLGDINTGDWINYGDINIPEAGTYKIVYRTSSYNGGAIIALKGTGDVALGTVAIPKTGSWSTWVDVEQTVTLPKGVQNLKIFAQVGGLNLNWFRIEAATTAVTPAPTPAPAPISSVIEAENYSTMTGVVVEATTDVGGGKSVGGISTGDSMSYANTPVNIPVTGKYKISYRVASPNANAIVALSDMNTNTLVDTLTVPKTGGWQKWVTVEREVTLNKGEFKFSMLAKAGGFNINWFKVETVTGGGSATTSSTSSVSSVQSSSSSSAPAVVSSSSSSAPAVVSSSSSSAPSVTQSSSSSSAAHVAGPVEISWTAPVKRENGADLYVDELGGYEIRYKKPTDTKYTYVSITDPWTQSYKFDWLEGDYVFQIAAFDKNGVYSPFQDIQRQ